MTHSPADLSEGYGISANWLKRQLALPGRSQSDLARFMNLSSPSIVNRMAQGRRDISAREADQIRAYLLATEGADKPSSSVEPQPGKSGYQPSDRALSFKAWMGRLGTNTRQVSNKSGVSYTTLASFVQGQTQSLRGDTEEMITAAYGQSVATIFEGDLGAESDEDRLIGLKIRSARRALGMNQADLGAALGVAQNTVSDMEAGKLSSWRIHIGKISAILNQPRSYFEADWVPAEPSRPEVPMTEAETLSALKAEVVRLSRTVERLEADVIRLAGMVALQSSTFRG